MVCSESNFLAAIVINADRCNVIVIAAIVRGVYLSNCDRLCKLNNGRRDKGVSHRSTNINTLAEFGAAAGDDIARESRGVVRPRPR